jgi:hypothetical protein
MSGLRIEPAPMVSLGYVGMIQSSFSSCSFLFDRSGSSPTAGWSRRGTFGTAGRDAINYLGES